MRSQRQAGNRGYWRGRGPRHALLIPEGHRALPEFVSRMSQGLSVIIVRHVEDTKALSVVSGGGGWGGGRAKHAHDSQHCKSQVDGIHAVNYHNG